MVAKARKQGIFKVPTLKSNRIFIPIGNLLQIHLYENRKPPVFAFYQKNDWWHELVATKPTLFSYGFLFINCPNPLEIRQLLSSMATFPRSRTVFTLPVTSTPS